MVADHRTEIRAMFLSTVLTHTLNKCRKLPPNIQMINKHWEYFRSCSLLATNGSLVAPKALDTTDEDLSIVTPNFQNTYNIAAYVNSSETLQNLVNLGVDLSKIETKPWVFEKFLKLDFERDMRHHVLFIQDFVGMDNVGHFITKNPLIFLESLDDIKTRVNYLTSKNFMDSQIKRIITKNPFWLSYRYVQPSPDYYKHNKKRIS